MADSRTRRSGGGDLIAWPGVVLTAVHSFLQKVEGTVLAPSSVPAPYDIPHDEKQLSIRKGVEFKSSAGSFRDRRRLLRCMFNPKHRMWDQHGDGKRP